MKWAYFIHLMGWIMPILLLQWAIGFRIFLRNWKSLAVPTLGGLIFYSLIDSVAVSQAIWHFDPEAEFGDFSRAAPSGGSFVLRADQPVGRAKPCAFPPRPSASLGYIGVLQNFGAV